MIFGLESIAILSPSADVITELLGTRTIFDVFSVELLKIGFWLVIMD